MDRILIIIVLAAIFGIGFWRIARRVRQIDEERTFAAEFHQHLVKYVNSTGQAQDSYFWLTKQSTKMQSQLGSLGYITYRPPFANYVINNFQIIVNLLPELRKSLDGTLSGYNTSEYAMMLQDCLLRQDGILERRREQSEVLLKNPLIWFREGVQFILSTPLYLAFTMGVIGSSMVVSIAHSVLFKFISGIVALIGFLSAIITIILGWEGFLGFLRDTVKLP